MSKKKAYSVKNVIHASKWIAVKMKSVCRTQIYFEEHWEPYKKEKVYYSFINRTKHKWTS